LFKFAKICIRLYLSIHYFPPNHPHSIHRYHQFFLRNHMFRSNDDHQVIYFTIKNKLVHCLLLTFLKSGSSFNETVHMPWISIIQEVKLLLTCNV
jgi:hypothetical protein